MDVVYWTRHPFKRVSGVFRDLIGGLEYAIVPSKFERFMRESDIH